jgi:CO/xanthine dehydrogenase Mo-binding subunit
VPDLLLAAEERHAQDALEKIRIDYEPLPFHVDPLRACTRQTRRAQPTATSAQRA